MTERPRGSESGPVKPLDLGEPHLDEFLRDLEALSERTDGEDQPWSASQLVAALTASEPEDGAQPELRARLMAALPEVSRFERFVGMVSQLLDIDASRAASLLDKLDNKTLFNELMPGIELFWVEGGPRVANAVRGFVRVAAGQDFPEHEHMGQEHVLVLQGAFHDPTQNRTFRPGDISVMSQGTSHMHIVPADGPDLLVLSVVQTGVSVGGQEFLPNQVPINY